jgi:hypothetical protein
METGENCLQLQPIKEVKILALVMQQCNLSRSEKHVLL